MVSDTTSSAAISAFDIPRAISLKTSSSRGVRSPSAAGAERWAAPERENSWIRRFVTDGRQQRVALGDHADAVHQLLGRHVLEQEAARAGAQRVVDVLVEVEASRLDVLRALQYE